MLSGCLRCAQEYADLKSMKEQVLQDKASIEAVIAELGQKKIEALQKTWAKVDPWLRSPDTFAIGRSRRGSLVAG